MARRTDTRRAVLKVGAGVGLAGIGALSGCLGDGGGSDSGESGDSEPTGTPTATPPPTPTPLPPQVAFTWEYSLEGSLTITHMSGELVRAGNLYVRGEAGSAQTGRWDSIGGSASGSHEGDSAVTAGDSVSLADVPADYQLSVVWETPEGVSATLDEDQGPNA